MASYTLGKKLIIESDDLDFVSRPEDFERIAQSVIDALDQRDLFLESRTKVGLRSSGVSAEVFLK